MTKKEALRILEKDKRIIDRPGQPTEEEFQQALKYLPDVTHKSEVTR